MNTSKTVDAARAIAAILLKKYFLKSMIFIVAATLLAFIASIYVGLHASTWWLLLAIFMALPLFVGIMSLVATVIVTARLQPRRLSPKETHQINTFVDQFVDRMRTPQSIQRTPFLLGSYIVWSYIKAGNNRNISHAITSPIHDIESLRKQFQDIVELF